jgi:hypothetical protein
MVERTRTTIIFEKTIVRTFAPQYDRYTDSNRSTNLKMRTATTRQKSQHHIGMHDAVEFSVRNLDNALKSAAACRTVGAPIVRNLVTGLAQPTSDLLLRLDPLQPRCNIHFHQIHPFAIALLTIIL